MTIPPLSIDIVRLSILSRCQVTKSYQYQRATSIFELPLANHTTPIDVILWSWFKRECPAIERATTFTVKRTNWTLILSTTPIPFVVILWSPFEIERWQLTMVNKGCDQWHINLFGLKYWPLQRLVKTNVDCQQQSFIAGRYLPLLLRLHTWLKARTGVYLHLHREVEHISYDALPNDPLFHRHFSRYVDLFEYRAPQWLCLSSFVELYSRQS